MKHMSFFKFSNILAWCWYAADVLMTFPAKLAFFIVLEAVVPLQFVEVIFCFSWRLLWSNNAVASYFTMH